MTATECIYRLLDFGEANGLFESEDRRYTLNRLLEILQMDAPEEIEYTSEPVPETATAYLNELCDRAVEAGIFSDSAIQRDLFSAKVMGAMTPHPQVVREKFAKLYAQDPAAATDWFYKLCKDVDYIRVDRIAKNVRFFEPSPCGTLEITINLSKPEKDPRDIAAALNQKSVSYPECQLCAENPGYAGRVNFPARQNHRIVPLKLSGNPWYLQYSPYAYYDEHCIVFNNEHIPMKIDHGSFVRLFDFVDQFPHYFLGSNADLPIVGGSILTHDHFQGGNHHFPMDDAGVRIPLTAPEAGITAYVSDWPMTCVVLKGTDREALTRLGDRVLTAWRGWTDEACDIYAQSYSEPNNTITPVARKDGDVYTLYLVLRNNRTSQQHPLGIFHPHADKHHIKSENIGLIEVMGLFILPGRLLKELAEVKRYLTGDRNGVPKKDDPMDKHYMWIRDLIQAYGTKNTPEDADKYIRHEVAIKCAGVLADAGVYKQNAQGNAGVVRFLNSVGFN